MSNYYRDAIEILSSAETDFRDIVFEVAKYNPKAIVMAHTRWGSDKALDAPPDWRDECRRLLDAGEKLRAAKLLRNETGLTLVQAREAIKVL